jgi:hypothetical protein
MDLYHKWFQRSTEKYGVFKTADFRVDELIERVA